MRHVAGACNHDKQDAGSVRVSLSSPTNAALADAEDKGTFTNDD